MGNTLTKKIPWEPDGLHKDIANHVIEVTNKTNEGLVLNTGYTFKDIYDLSPEKFKELNIEAQKKFHELTYQIVERHANEIKNNYIKQYNDINGEVLQEGERRKAEYLKQQEDIAILTYKDPGDNYVKTGEIIREYMQKKGKDLSPEFWEKTKTLQEATNVVFDPEILNSNDITSDTIKEESGKVLEQLGNIKINNQNLNTSINAVTNAVENTSNPVVINGVNKIYNTKIMKNFGKKQAAIFFGVLAVIATIGSIVKSLSNKTTTTPFTTTPFTGNTTTPNPSQTGELTPWDAEILTSLIVEKISGCYMFTNNGGKITATRLDGCSNWYNNMNNQFYCSCFKTTDTKKTLPTPDDCKDEACNSPYCLNQIQSSCQKSDTKKCNVDNELYMCNGNSINDEGFVFYAYQYFPPEAIMAVLTEIAENENKSNIVPIIIGSVIIIVVIFVIIYLIMHSKKGKKKLINK
jgi:hypothetical protein